MRISHLLGARYVLVISVAIFPVVSHAVIIDFQSLEHNDIFDANHGSTYSEDGFTLLAQDVNTVSGFFISRGTGATNYRGSTGLTHALNHGITELTRSDGGLFDIFSIDLGELANTNNVNPYNADVTFNGYKSNGDVVSQTFSLDGVRGVGFGYETFNFTGDFTVLSKVTWRNTFEWHQFDNISVANAVIPIPAAVWLFGSGLLGMIGIARRKQTA